MRSFWKIISITLILVVTYFIADIGRYFIYPNVSYLKKNRPEKTAFMKYREEVWREKGIKKKDYKYLGSSFQSISLCNESCDYRRRR